MTHPGSSVLGVSITRGTTAAAAGSLPFTGLPMTLVSLLMAAMLAIAVGVALMRMAKLRVAERQMDAPRFTA